MLFDMDENEISHMPHQDDYDRWRANLTKNDYHAMIDKLHLEFDKASEEKVELNSSYIPGKDWEISGYQPIFHACGDNYDVAKLFFGLLVWEAAQSHEKNWIFIRRVQGTAEKPFGLTYFEKQ
jgi:hypothetical protein